MKNWVIILFLLPTIVLAQFTESQLANTEWRVLADNFFRYDSNIGKKCGDGGCEVICCEKKSCSIEDYGKCQKICCALIKIKLLEENKLEYWVKNMISWEEKGSSDIHSWEIEDEKIIFWINDKYLRFEGNIKYLTDYDILEVSGKWKNKGMGLTKYKFSAYIVNKEPFFNIAINQKIKKIVEDSIKRYYTKGEFEKISDYQKRIKNINQEKLITKYQKIAINNLKESYKNSITSKIKLLEYDAENETFAFYSKHLGTFFLEVPLNEAQKFKSDYKNMVSGGSVEVKINNIDFHIYNNSFQLSNIEFTHSYNYNYETFGGVKGNKIKTKKYIYSIDKEIEYATTDINYDIGEINIKNIESKNTISNKNITKSNKLSIRNYSSVDKNIPDNKKVKDRYALVIGNEDYQSKQRGLSDEQNVDYAVNDAIIFKEYALKTLGVDKDNMFFLTDATAVEMGREIKRINKIMSKLGNKGELIIYYAGHGHPDEKTNIPYLIPVDVSANDLSYAIKLDELYQKLSKNNSKRITIFLDACFTGGGRSSGLMASRGVRIKPVGGTLNGNIVVFSASSGDQSALPYHKENHGMFTYHLLKKLQESKGNIKMGELASYLQDEVSLKSLKINDKEQDPVVNTSKDINTTWKEWEF